MKLASNLKPIPFNDPRSRAAWKKAAWPDDGDDALLLAARNVESINQLLAEYHAQRPQQDLAGFLGLL